MKKVVVDASVILKWVLGGEKESDKDKAMDLLKGWGDGRIEIYAPSLWHYEVGNFLGRELPSEAEQKMSLLVDLHIGDVSVNDKIYRRCFAWMNGKKVTFYDAVYLSSAFEIEAVLVTADEEFIKRMGKIDHLCSLAQLGNVMSFQ